MILKPQSILSIKTPVPGVTVLQGALWLTQTGDPQDYILSTGQSMELPGSGWVIQALEACEIQLSPGPAVLESPEEGLCRPQGA